MKQLEMPTTFIKWLEMQQYRDDPVGDIAIDSILCKAKCLGDIVRYVTLVYSSPEAKQALKETVDEYKSLQKRYPKLYL